MPGARILALFAGFERWQAMNGENGESLEHLRRRAEELVPSAAGFVHRGALASSAPPDGGSGDFDEVLAELARLEAAVTAAGDVDEPWSRSLRMVLGGLYGTRYLNGGRELQDRAEGLRLLRPARAAGRLRAEDDPATARLLSVLLLPPSMLGGFTGGLDNFLGAMQLGQMMVTGDSGAADTVEAFTLIREVAALGPDETGVAPAASMPKSLIAAAEFVHTVHGTGTVPQDQLFAMLSMMAADPKGSGPLADLAGALSTIMGMFFPGAGSAASAAPRPEPAPPQPELSGERPEPVPDAQSEPDQPPQEQGVDSDDFRWMALLLDMLAPGLLGPGDMTTLIGQLDDAGAAGDPASLVLAAGARTVQGLRSGQNEWRDVSARQLQEVLDGPGPQNLTQAVRMVLPGLLAASALTGGNLQDADKSAELLELLGAAPTGPLGLDTVGQVMLGLWQRTSTALENEDLTTLKAVAGELPELEERVDPDNETYSMVQFFGFWLELCIARFELGHGTQDDRADRLRKAVHHMDKALAAPNNLPFMQPLLDVAAPVVLGLSSLIESQPRSLDEAVTRARRSLDQTAVTVDQRVLGRLQIAMALETQYLGFGEQALLEEELRELETAAAELTEDNGPDVVNGVFWALADGYRRRGGADPGDLDRSVSCALRSLRAVAESVLLQLGAEHGLRSARAGAEHGLRAARWAARADRAEQAVACLEAGRALVLQSAATTSRVPGLLEAAGEPELARRWRNEVDEAGRPADAAGRRLAPASAELTRIPSELRRSALAALRRGGGGGGGGGPSGTGQAEFSAESSTADPAQSQTFSSAGSQSRSGQAGGLDPLELLAAAPSVAELCAGVAEAGLDALSGQAGGLDPLELLAAAPDVAELCGGVAEAGLDALSGQAGGLDPLELLAAAPSVAELCAGVAEAGLDALVYLIPGGEDIEGKALILTPESARVLALPGLSPAPALPFEAYLDAAAARSVRLRGATGDRDAVIAGGPPPVGRPGPEGDWERALEELCDWAGSAVLDPILDAVCPAAAPQRPGRLLLVPCGNLGVVPWHAARLSRPPAGFGLSRPVRACDLAVLSYAASGREFLRSLGRTRAPLADHPVLIADPSRTLYWPETEVTLVRDAFLPGARLLGCFSGTRDDSTGTPEQVLALLTGSQSAPASLLHVASHGLVGLRPTLSALLLATPAATLPAASAGAPLATPPAAPAGGPGARPPEAYLTVTRVLDSVAQGKPDDLGTLVVLSACETDLSDRDFDEALTLSTAFTARGAADAVGSRWTVGDRASAVLMVVFHRRLSEGLTPADALRSAQLWMLDEDREVFPELARSPLGRGFPAGLHRTKSWAAFVHQGIVRDTSREGSAG